MKHKHYDMIVAKAANMDLVVFVKTCDSGAWYTKGDNGACQWWEDSDYFLCLPKHKSAVLSSLNGEVARAESAGEMLEHALKEAGWSCDDWYMSEDFVSSIKPKKEKRWIGVFKDTLPISGTTVYKNTEMSYKTIEGLKNECHAPDGFDHWQFIEIEVEV